MRLVCATKQGILGRWIIVNANDVNLAWTGLRWAGHDNGIPTGAFQICNFKTEAEIEAYIRENWDLISKATIDRDKESTQQ